jgi:hypothetical protein
MLTTSPTVFKRGSEIGHSRHHERRSRSDNDKKRAPSVASVYLGGVGHSESTPVDTCVSAKRVVESGSTVAVK